MKPRRVTILRKGLFVIALPLVYQALFIGLLLKRQSDQNAAQHWAMHTKDVIERTEHVFRLLISTQSDLRGLLLTGKSTFIDEMNRDEASLKAGICELEGIDPGQSEAAGALPACDAKRAGAARLSASDHGDDARPQGRAHAQEEVKNLKGKELMDALRA